MKNFCWKSIHDLIQLKPTAIVVRILQFLSNPKEKYFIYAMNPIYKWI